MLDSGKGGDDGPYGNPGKQNTRNAVLGLFLLRPAQGFPASIAPEFNHGKKASIIGAVENAHSTLPSKSIKTNFIGWFLWVFCETSEHGLLNAFQHLLKPLSVRQQTFGNQLS